MKSMLVIKVQQCVGCKSCEISCAVEHSDDQELFAAIRQDPPPVARVTVAQGEGFAAPLQCRQCEDAPCVAICPTHALHRPDADSPVLLEADACIGCTWCVLACPFGVIKLDGNSHAIIKCDQCRARVQEGEQPACVVGCPTGALTFKTMDEVLAEKREAVLADLKRSQGGAQ